MPQFKAYLRNLYYTFPVQLIRLQLKHNILLLSLWVILFAIISGQLGASMGMYKLFLNPEYRGEVGFWSFFIIGMAYGSFFIAWNTSIYILNSYRFPFLAALYRPFSKFSFNNCVIPVFFFLFYCYKIVAFQWYNEYRGYGLFYCLGGILGTLLMILLAMVYFYYTNTDVQNYHKQNRLKLSKVLKEIVVQRKERSMSLQKDGLYKNAWRVDFFLNERFQWRIVRQVGHYNFKLLERVFRQNHANAFVIQSISIILLILMAALVEYELFRIPAAASLLLLFSILTTVIGALTYWLEEWRVLSLLLAFFLINKMMTWGLFSYQNSAYGLDYGVEPVPYSLPVLDSLCSTHQYQKDSEQMLKVLETWRSKFDDQGTQKKPKMVLLCVSGGGIRASLWSHHVMREADHITQGRLMAHTALITGASGGMWGAGLYRELYHQKRLGRNIDMYDKRYLNYSAKDLMNSLAFTFLVNDIFIPWVSREVNGYMYRQDRGYSFEQQFIENTNGLLAHDLAYYQQAEKEGLIPLLFLTPLIANDSRMMVISPQPVSFMMKPPFSHQGRTRASKIDAVDYGALFKGHNPMSLRFVTALRMNATFPFIFPSVQMPTKPTISLVDAGFRDNFGLEMATRFAAVFRKWIRANTSGVVIVSVRSYAQSREISEITSQSLAELFFNPLEPMFAIDALQNYHHDNYVSFLKSKIGRDKVEVVDFVYAPTLLEKQASLSLHLTQREKNDILNAITLKKNKHSMNRLKQLLH